MTSNLLRKRLRLNLTFGHTRFQLMIKIITFDKIKVWIGGSTIQIKVIKLRYFTKKY